MVEGRTAPDCNLSIQKLFCNPPLGNYVCRLVFFALPKRLFFCHLLSGAA